MNIERFTNILGHASRPSISPETYQDFLYSENGKPGRDYLVSRGLNKTTAKHFRIGLTDTMEISMPVFKHEELVDYKYRSILEKKFRRHSGGETWCFFEKGLEYAKEDGYLLITEGEIDCMSLFQLGFKSVVSVTSGALGATPWLNEIPEKAKIFINFDFDEVGQEAAAKLAERIGLDKCLNIVLKDVKDANEFLQKGGTKEQFQELIDSAQQFKIEGILRIQDAIEGLEKNRVQRIPTFLDRLTHHLGGGIPKAGIITISGNPKCGKSSLLMNMVVNHAKEGIPTLLVSLENDLYFTIQRLLEIISGKQYKDLTHEDFNNLKETMADLPLYLDVSLGNWDIKRIEKVVGQMRKLYGIEVFGFDHLGYLSGDEVKDIDDVMRRIKMMSRNLNIVSYIVCHVRKTPDNQKYPTYQDLRGSSSIAAESNAILFMQGNRGGTYIDIDLSRMSRSKLNIPVNFDGTTGIISEDLTRDVTHYGELVQDN